MIVNVKRKFGKILWNQGETKMYELIQISENDYYIESPAKVGLVNIGDGKIILIDSGSDKDAAKKIAKHIDSNCWTLAAIFNTHYHADHIGGNKFLQNKYGCKIFAPRTELGFVLDPKLEPSFLYGGNPPSELQKKFLMAEPSDAELLTDAVLPNGMGILPLPGHSFNMVGFKTADGNFFIADSLSSEATLEKYQIGFLTDVKAYLDTLEMLKSENAKLFIPSHAAVTEDIASLAQVNVEKTLKIADDIVSLCSDGKGFDELLKSVFDLYGLTMTFEQNALIGSTLRSYLTYLKECGRVTVEIVENTLIWKS